MFIVLCSHGYAQKNASAGIVSQGDVVPDPRDYAYEAKGRHMQ